MRHVRQSDTEKPTSLLVLLSFGHTHSRFLPATHQLLVPVAVERVLHRRSVGAPSPDVPRAPAWVAGLQANPHDPRAVDSGRYLNIFGPAAPVVVGARGGSALGVYVHAAHVAPFGRKRGGQGGNDLRIAGSALACLDGGVKVTCFFFPGRRKDAVRTDATLLCRDKDLEPKTQPDDSLSIHRSTNCTESGQRGGQERETEHETEGSPRRYQPPSAANTTTGYTPSLPGATHSLESLLHDADEQLPAGVAEGGGVVAVQPERVHRGERSRLCGRTRPKPGTSDEEQRRHDKTHYVQGYEQQRLAGHLIKQTRCFWAMFQPYLTEASFCNVGGFIGLTLKRRSLSPLANPAVSRGPPIPAEQTSPKGHRKKPKT